MTDVERTLLLQVSHALGRLIRLHAPDETELLTQLTAARVRLIAEQNRATASDLGLG